MDTSLLKSTPGPYDVAFSIPQGLLPSGFYSEIRDYNNKPIAYVLHTDDDEGRATANQMAASREMLELLLEIKEVLDYIFVGRTSGDVTLNDLNLIVSMLNLTNKTIATALDIDEVP